MELKIRIKEVKEEKRPLTIGETCMISVSREDIFSRSYRDKVQTELDCMGFVDYVEYDRTCGFFRTETIRDATQDEVIAWHCIGIAKMCGVMEWCMDCPKSKEDFLCYQSGEARVAEEFLKNKEVILEFKKYEQENLFSDGGGGCLWGGGFSYYVKHYSQ